MPAAEIEAAVVDQLRGIFRQSKAIVGTWRAADQNDSDPCVTRFPAAGLSPLVGTSDFGAADGALADGWKAYARMAGLAGEDAVLRIGGDFNVMLPHLVNRLVRVGSKAPRR